MSTATVDETLVVSVDEAARLLGVRAAAIRALIHSGELKAARLGGGWVWKIRRSDLDAYVEARLATTDTAPKPRVPAKASGRKAAR